MVSHVNQLGLPSTGTPADFVAVFDDDSCGRTAAAATWVDGRYLVSVTAACIGSPPSVRLSTFFHASPTTGDVTSLSPPIVPTVDYVARQPLRVLDTRPGSLVGHGGPVPGADATVELGVVASGGLAAGTEAVALTVTGTEAATDGYVTVWPCDRPRPLASNVNVGVGRGVREPGGDEGERGGDGVLVHQRGDAPRG